MAIRMIAKKDVIENMLVFMDAMLRGLGNSVIDLALNNGWIPDSWMLKLPEVGTECHASKFLFDNNIEEMA